MIIDSDLEGESDDNIVHDPKAARDNYVPFSVEHSINQVCLPNLVQSSSAGLPEVVIKEVNADGSLKS